MIFKNEAREEQAKQVLVNAGIFDPNQTLTFTGGLLQPDPRVVARFRFQNLPYSETSPVTKEALETIQETTAAMNKRGASCLSYLRTFGQNPDQNRQGFLNDDSVCFFPPTYTLTNVDNFFAGFPEVQVTRVELPRQVTLEVATKDVGQLISELKGQPLVAQVIRKREVQNALSR